MNSRIRTAGWLNISQATVVLGWFSLPIIGGRTFIDWYWEVLDIPVLGPREEFITLVANFYWKACLPFIAIAMLYIWSSIKLFDLNPWARKATLFFSVLTFGILPIGPIAAGYSVWVFTRKETKQIFARRLSI